MMRMVALVLSIFAVAGCSHTMAVAPAGEPMAEFERVPLETVFERIKREVGLFIADGIATRARWLEYSNAMGAGPGCATGKPFDFVITKVKMTFSIEHDNTASAGGTAKIPLPYVLAAVGPSAKYSLEGKTSQQLTYYYYPKGKPYYGTELARKDAIIVNDLDALRDAIVSASKVEPCFSNTPDNTKDEPNLVFAVSVIKDGSAALGITFVPAALSISASGEAKSTTGNMIVVTFKPKNT